jgi:peptidoglycan-associated lipoprotein
MQFNKITKGLMVALPLFMLTACGSTSDSQQTDASTNQQVEESTTTGGVEVNTMEDVKTPEMIQAEQEAELRKVQTVYFDFDKANVDAKFLEMLQAHANFLVKNPDTKLTIEGHCDERGTPEYNIALGEKRAKAVSQYLQNLGVMAGQISTVSYGEEKPLDMSRTNAGFAKNRRAVLVY